MADLYLWIKALHVVAIIAWMAGLFYLPRLFVYHAEADLAVDGPAIAKFQIMEERLLRVIMNPAMIISWVSGLYLASASGAWSEPWFHVKVLLVVLMTGFHMATAKWRKQLLADPKGREGKFYRIANEVPTVLVIGIVIMVIVKPFS